jgi:hypothetical protein
MGWTQTTTEPVSPWAVVGTQGWPAPLASPADFVCCRSGRPAYGTGETIELTSAQVPPVEIHKYENAFGDGQFTLTVTNRSNEPVEIPALRTDGQTILWADSIVVLSGSLFYWLPGGGRMAYLLPGAGHAAPTQPVRLAPGESVSTIIDVLSLTAFQVRPGGARLYYQFYLGVVSELAPTGSTVLQQLT